tara:strand:+ start:711 stop:1703 length:993 start_codon:yes stop_codon:yes gene_type:complete
MSQLLSRVAETPLTQELAATLKAAGDPLRLEILRLLARDSFGVMELSRIFAIKQSSMSHHLKVMATAGLVATRREGNSIFYRRQLPAADDPLYALQNSLCIALDTQPLPQEVQVRLSDIQRERASASQAFFADNATKFRQQQELIASFSAYADGVAEMLKQTTFAERIKALEVGPGEGEFLATLSQQFKQVIALDNSKSMLNKARRTAQTEQLDNIEFIHGDTTYAVEQGCQVDCAVINMVLHHVPSPAQIFDDVSHLLKSGGCLLVADLCHHDQQWAKEACGDVWLGFEPDDFSHWAQQAGLQTGQSQYIALRNGFQIQVRQFFKPHKG